MRSSTAVVAVAGDDEGALAVALGDRLDELGAAVDQPHAVVRAVGRRAACRRRRAGGPAGDGAPRSRSARRCRTAGSPRPLVTARSSGPNESVVPPAYQQIEPAETPASTTPASQTRRKTPVEVVHPPHGEQVRDRAAVDPHDVLVEQVALDVVEVGHGEEVQVGEVEAGDPARLVDARRRSALVAATRCRAMRDRGRRPWHPDSSTAWCTSASNSRPGARAIAVATRGGQDRGLVCRHAPTLGGPVDNSQGGPARLGIVAA